MPVVSTEPLNPFIQNIFFYLKSFDKSISYRRVSGWLLFFFIYILLSCFVEIPKLNANRLDPDQMSRSAASDLGLHCLPMPLFMGG